MGKSQKALITPSVLKWARESMRFTIFNVSQKIKRSEKEIRAWENGDSLPTFAQARKLSILYKRPLATFYLPEPPSDFSVLKDFRRLPEEMSKEYSPQLALLIREIQSKQQWLKDFFIYEEKQELDFIGSVSISTQPNKVAKIMRNRLEISISQQLKIKTKEAFLKVLIEKIESLGVAVSRQGKIDTSEIRGLTISDKIAPFIFINSNDAKSAQIFTLIHEFAHLWINISGISNINNSFSPNLHFDKTEIFCNKVSAEFFLGNNDFSEEWDKISSKEELFEAIAQVANKFKVSSEVVARKLLNKGIITETKYSELRKKFHENWIEFKKQEKERWKNRKGGPSPHLLKVVNNGYLFTQIVLSAYSNGLINGRTTSSLLGAKINNFEKIYIKALA